MTELNILLVEDDELLRKSVFKLLKDGGHRVKGCDCLADARKAVKQTSFHLAFLDMRLPDGNGLDFYKEIEEACPGIKIVIVTAFSDVRTAVAAIKLGAYDYLPKPFEHAQLEKIVRNVAQNVDLNAQDSSLSRLT